MARIATALMTSSQREKPVTALAVLITAWQHGHADESDVIRQDRFPFPARRATLTTPRDIRADHWSQS